MSCVICAVSSSVNKTVSAIMLIQTSVSNLKLKNMQFGLGLISHLCSGAVGNLCQCCYVMEPLQVLHLLPNDEHHLCLWCLPQSLKLLVLCLFLEWLPSFTRGVFHFISHVVPHGVQ